MVPTTLVLIKSDRSTIRNDNVIVRMIVWYNADPCRFELYWIGIGNGLVLNDFDKSIIILLDNFTSCIVPSVRQNHQILDIPSIIPVRAIKLKNTKRHKCPSKLI